MKIDLHMHTKKILNSEKDTRNIYDPQKFNEIMEKANIQIGAITNHNTFDLKQYNELKSIDNSYLLLPGIEYDVNVSSKEGEIARRQINIIYNPDKVKEFNLKTTETNSSWQKPIDINEIIKQFDSEDTIFYFDYKQNKTSWTEEEYNKYLLKNENIHINGVVIFDTNKTITHFVLMANNFSSLIGSDLDNWDEYVEKNSKNLVDSQIKFNNYNIFISVLKGKKDLEIVQTLRQETKVDISNKEKNIDLKGIPLTNGVNIIFGSKSTGKSALLDEIYNQYHSSKTIYKSENMNSKYNSILEKTKPIDDFNESIKTLTDNLINISNYQEDHFKDFKNFYEHSQHPPKISLQHTKLKNIIPQIEQNKEITSLSKEYKNFISAIEKQINENDLLLQKHLELYKETSNWLRDKYLKINKEYFSYTIMNKIKSEIAKILKTKRGETSQPSSLGLISLFNSRKELWQSIENIRSIEKYHSKEIQTFDIPDGNSWVHKQELNLFDPNEKQFIKGINYNEKKWINKKQLMKDGLKKLFEIDKYSDPRNYIEKSKELLNTNIDLYCFKNQLFNEISPNSQPSNGEKAYISLFTALEEDADAFFLDEPETYLGNKMISISLIEKLKDLTMNKKKIIMTTHVSSLGINTLPFNYIYRDIETYGDDVYKTYVGTLNGDNELKCIRSGRTIKLIDNFINHFEGNVDQFNFRKEIYEKN